MRRNVHSQCTRVPAYEYTAILTWYVLFLCVFVVSLLCNLSLYRWGIDRGSAVVHYVMAAVQ